MLFIDTPCTYNKYFIVFKKFIHYYCFIIAWQVALKPELKSHYESLTRFYNKISEVLTAEEYGLVVKWEPGLPGDDDDLQGEQGQEHQEEDMGQQVQGVHRWPETHCNEKKYYCKSRNVYIVNKSCYWGYFLPPWSSDQLLGCKETRGVWVCSDGVKEGGQTSSQEVTWVICSWI